MVNSRRREAGSRSGPAGRSQPLPVQRHEQRDIGSCRMAADADFLRVAAVPGDIAARPGNRCRAVLHKRREFHLGHEAIIRHHDDKALRRQRPRCKGIILPPPAVPAAAVEKHDDRRVAGFVGLVDIELLARVAAECDVGGFPARTAIARRQIVDGVQRRKRRTPGKRQCSRNRQQPMAGSEHHISLSGHYLSPRQIRRQSPGRRTAYLPPRCRRSSAASCAAVAARAISTS